MNRIWLAFLLVAVLAPAGTASAAERAPASVRVSECQPGADAATRSAAFEATMRQLPGSRRMQVRFVLLERLGNGRFERVDAPGLGVWRTSRAGVRRFVYTQRVDGLKADAAYRVSVRYRWLDEDLRPIRSARRRSSVCEVEGALPNLQVLKISARRGAAPGTATYSVVVRNAGRADATQLGVGFMVDGAELTAVKLPALIALETRSVRFTGPACTAALSAVIDSDNAVREEAEDDNVQSIPCPFS